MLKNKQKTNKHGNGNQGLEVRMAHLREFVPRDMGSISLNTPVPKEGNRTVSDKGLVYVTR